MKSRRTFTFARAFAQSLATLSLVLTGGAFAQAFPNKPVKLVVPYPAGGFPDTVARIVGKALGEKWNQQVVIDNKPGANGVVAAQTIKGAPADGYTLLVTDGSMFTINPLLYPKLDYDLKRDFVPLSITARAPLFLTAHSSVPANNLAEFIAYAKANPGKIAYGSSGVGSTHHLSTEAFKSALGLDMVHIPFKGMGQATPALIGGQIQVLFTALPAISGFVKENRVKLFAQNSSQRFKGMSNIPTLAENAIPGFNFSPSTNFFAPVGVPANVLAQIEADVNGVVKSAAVTEALLNVGVDAVGGSSADLAKLLADETDRYGKVVKQVGVKAE